MERATCSIHVLMKENSLGKWWNMEDLMQQLLLRQHGMLCIKPSAASNDKLQLHRVGSAQRRGRLAMKQSILKSIITGWFRYAFILGVLAYLAASPFYADASDEGDAHHSNSLNLSVDEGTLEENPARENDIVLPRSETRSSLYGPNLTPYQLSGWSSPLVVSTSQGDHRDDTPLYDTDTLYLDYAVANLGNMSTVGQTFWIAIFIDGVEIISKGPLTTLLANNARYFEDQLLRLSTGTYTLALIVDSKDQISETDETDNEYERIITIEKRGDEEIRFLSLNTDLGNTVRVGDQITFIASALGQEAIHYRFLYKAGYGTEAYNTPGGWVTAQDWSEDSLAGITFTNADDYIVIVQASDTPGVWSAGDPQIGMSVNVRGQ